MNNFQRSGLVIGIDATNLKRGGGLTHLIELIGAADPKVDGFSRIVVFGGRLQLEKLPVRIWLEKYSPPDLDMNLFRRIFWQRFKLGDLARLVGCDVLFVPGGSYAADFHPVVAMSQNMLPFEWKELRRFGFTTLALKLFILRIVQSRTFHRAAGVIFLTKYAKQGILKVTGQLSAATSIIPHGISSRFQIYPKKQKPISHYSESKPFRILYVSIIDNYKHQWHVVEAIANLRNKNLPILLDLIGPAYAPALARLNKTIDRFDPLRSWTRYHGSIPFERLHQFYADADIGLFASSCENMPNILLEMMASGLPIACSISGPMPEVLGNAGAYFNPEKPIEIEHAISSLIESPDLREKLSHLSYQRAQKYSWKRCANDTFKFLASIVAK